MDFNCLWNPPEKLPLLALDEVHVWCFSLITSVEQRNYFLSLLAEKELARAKRFRFEKDQNAYIAGRGNLRCILANYLQCDPQAVKFRYNQYGKPEIDFKTKLKFNLSHAQQAALCAVTLNNEIGVDIEYMERDCEMDAIADRFFSLRESTELHSLTGDNKKQAFFNAWTRKEAFLKAFGQGLSYSLKKVDVNITPQQPAKILSLHDPKLNAEDWFIQELNPLDHYAGAVVVNGNPREVKMWEWKKY